MVKTTEADQQRHRYGNMELPGFSPECPLCGHVGRMILDDFGEYGTLVLGCPECYQTSELDIVGWVLDKLKELTVPELGELLKDD